MLKKFFREENGQSMVLFALSIFALIGFAGLAIDGGRLYMAKSQLQKAVDAGALAGADILLDEIKTGSASGVNYTTVSSKITAITDVNYKQGSYSYDPTKYGTKAVEVSGNEAVNLMIMPVLGINKTSSVHAVARVKIGNISKIGKGMVIPVGINLDMLKDPSDPSGTKLQFGVEMNITDSPGTGVNGYYGFLNFSSLPGVDSSNGASALKDYILNGSPVPISIGDEISQEKGENTGPANKAITDRVGDIVYVPIVTGPNSNGKMVVEGFAAFKLIDYVTKSEEKGKDKTETHVIKAEFLHIANDGDVGDGIIDYGIYDAKLEL